MKTVGVLALQGDFEAHRKALEKVSESGTEVRVLEVRNAAELAQCDGLIVPGGESTTMLKLLQEENLLEPIKQFGQKKPIYGTCAGAILLARDVTHPVQIGLDLMDIGVERNGYGRQIDSRIAPLHIGAAQNGGGDFEAVFIRAPIIRRVGEGVHVVASYNGDPVWVEQGRHMVTTFHPELTGDCRVHKRFVERL